MRQTTRIVLAGFVFAATLLPASSPGEEPAKKIEFTDAREQALEFIRYYETIQLTREQEAVKREALSPLPAACCSNNSAYTCCCICNLSRTAWGLTAYLIAEHDATVEEIQTAVKEWIGFVNPGGFSGDACFKGGCMRSFDKGGCGGMQASRVIWE